MKSYTLLAIVLLTSGCSVSNNDYSYDRSAARNLPEIPTVRIPPASHNTLPPQETQKKPYKPEIHKYTPNKTTDTITQTEVAAINNRSENTADKSLNNKAENTANKWEEEIKKKVEVTTDPYENIPDDSVSSKKTKVTNASQNSTRPSKVKTSVKPAKTPIESSSAVKTLLVKARADLAIGRTTSAIDKLERGLRIEPRNPLLWHQLARANYEKQSYTQAISMAKKSIQNTNRDYIIAKNWMLIKQAGLKSSNTVVVKEATDYFKIKP